MSTRKKKGEKKGTKRKTPMCEALKIPHGIARMGAYLPPNDYLQSMDGAYSCRFGTTASTVDKGEDFILKVAQDFTGEFFTDEDLGIKKGEFEEARRWLNRNQMIDTDDMSKTELERVLKEREEKEAVIENYKRRRKDTLNGFIGAVHKGFLGIDRCAVAMENVAARLASLETAMTMSPASVFADHDPKKDADDLGVRMAKKKEEDTNKQLMRNGVGICIRCREAFNQDWLTNGFCSACHMDIKEEEQKNKKEDNNNVPLERMVEK